MTTTIRIQCSDCGRDFSLPLRDYQAELSKPGGTTTEPRAGKSRPWYCSLECLNGGRERLALQEKAEREVLRAEKLALQGISQAKMLPQEQRKTKKEG